MHITLPASLALYSASMLGIRSSEAEYRANEAGSVICIVQEGDLYLSRIHIYIRDILPKVLTAGEKAGTLTEEVAKRLYVSGNRESGILLAPPEGCLLYTSSQL